MAACVPPMNFLKVVDANVEVNSEIMELVAALLKI